MLMNFLNEHSKVWMAISQQQLKTVSKWCKRCGLAVNPNKVEVILFIHKQQGTKNYRIFKLSGYDKISNQKLNIHRVASR